MNMPKCFQIGTASRLILAATLSLTAAATANSTILFRPVNRPPEVFAFNGTTISQPLASNPNALNSPRVYFIFVGPNWVHNGAPTSALNSMVYAARAILGSSYLSGLKQYGSDGFASYGDYAIDTGYDPTINPSQNPVWTEANKFLSNPAYSSWLPPPGDARNSPIYVEVRYGFNGTNVPGGAGGSNNFGPNQSTPLAINAIDVYLTSADQVDQFSWVLSHELVERMSTGIGGVSEVSPDKGGQIADGEPEGGDYYAWRLYGSVGPVVTSYWSVLDQAFTIPDGTLQRAMVVPIWNGGSFTGNFVSAQQGNLYLMTAPSTQVLIDTNVQSYAIASLGGASQLFDLTATGQVRAYSGSGTNWNVVTTPNIVASSLAATSDGSLYMLASDNNQPSQVWRYSGLGSAWFAVTVPNTAVSAIEAAGSTLYMLASNTVFAYSGSGTTWVLETISNMHVSRIAAAGGELYIMASYNGQPNRVFLRDGLIWIDVTPAATSVDDIAVAGDVLVMQAFKTGDYKRIWQYGLVPGAWTPLTGPNTNPKGFVVQDGSALFMMAANGGGLNQVWQYAGTPLNWTALTGLNTNVDSISVGTNNRLYMVASNNGGPTYDWIYDETPYQWTILFPHLVDPPAVTSLNPTFGSQYGQTLVDIYGANLSQNMTLKFGPNVATFYCHSSQWCTATSPAGTGLVNVTVTSGNYTSPAAPGNAFTYKPFPVIFYSRPLNGKAGDTVTVNGLNFLTAPGATTFTFGGVPATNVQCTVNTCTMTAPVPDETFGWEVTISVTDTFIVKSLLGFYTYSWTTSGGILGPAAGGWFTYPQPPAPIPICKGTTCQ